jgi:hypothetical protein
MGKMTDDLKARLLNEIGLSLEGTAMEAAARIEVLERAIVDYVSTVVSYEGVTFIRWMEDGESKVIVDQLWYAHQKEEARR